MKEQLVGASWETSSLLSHMKHPLTGEDVLSISFSLRVLNGGSVDLQECFGMGGGWGVKVFINFLQSLKSAAHSQGLNKRVKLLACWLKLLDALCNSAMHKCIITGH